MSIPPYTLMQGLSEFGISSRLAEWGIKNTFHEITIPTLMIDANMTQWIQKQWKNKAIKKGTLSISPSHLIM